MNFKNAWKKLQKVLQEAHYDSPILSHLLFIFEVCCLNGEAELSLLQSAYAYHIYLELSCHKHETFVMRKSSHFIWSNQETAVRRSSHYPSVFRSPNSPRYCTVFCRAWWSWSPGSTYSSNWTEPIGSSTRCHQFCFFHSASQHNFDLWHPLFCQCSYSFGNNFSAVCPANWWFAVP